MVLGWLGGCWEDGDSTKGDPVLALLPSHRTQGTEVLGWGAAGRGFPPGLKPGNPGRIHLKGMKEESQLAVGDKERAFLSQERPAPQAPAFPG